MANSAQRKQRSLLSTMTDSRTSEIIQHYSEGQKASLKLASFSSTIAKLCRSFKLCRTLGQIFNKPKDRPQRELQRTGIVKKLRCSDWPFTYLGESKRPWSLRGAADGPGLACNGESKSTITKHAQRTDHDIHPRKSKILELQQNERKVSPRLYFFVSSYQF